MVVGVLLPTVWTKAGNKAGNKVANVYFMNGRELYVANNDPNYNMANIFVIYCG